MNMKRLHKDQRGFSILELLLVMILTGLITTAITTTFFQVFNMNTRTANHMIAVSQVQQAGKLVSEDMLEAQADRIDDSPPGKFLKLGWFSQNTSTEYEIIYTLEDGVLWRSETIGEEPPATTRVAEYINADQTSCVWGSGVLTFTVTATVGQESETRVYEVKPRPGAY